MRLVVLALALAACTPDGDFGELPILPSSGGVPARSNTQEGPDIGPDAGTPTLGDGGLFDNDGGTSDARGVFDGGGLTPFDGGLDLFLDAPQGGVDQIPGNPDQIP